MSPDMQTVTALVTAGLPTLTVLVSLLINNQRLTDIQKNMDRHFDEQRDMWRADLFRVEQVLDARLKHLEEHR